MLTIIERLLNGDNLVGLWVHEHVLSLTRFAADGADMLTNVIDGAIRSERLRLELQKQSLWNLRSETLFDV